jgi:predicted RNase H-like HicB family nuclease
MREYAAVFEKASTGWSAYVPDLPGLGVAGATYEATEQLLREGIAFTSKECSRMETLFPNRQRV